jgi:hypothetical protein
VAKAVAKAKEQLTLSGAKTSKNIKGHAHLVRLQSGELFLLL